MNRILKRNFESICGANNIMNNNDSNNDSNNIPVKKQKRDDDDDDDNLVNLSRFLFPPNSPEFVNNNVNRPKFKKNECANPSCNHKTYEEDPTEVKIPNIKKISSIEDLIALGKSYHCKKNKEYAGINLKILYNLVGPLTELSNMVGMTKTKLHIIDQIMYFLQGNNESENKEMLHTVITGPPGVGKTEFGKILGKVYKEMGVLSKGTFKLATRADLVAGYLGQTALKTQAVIDEAQGGVLFIDEAYSLGNSELRDSFSKECIDTLNQNLTERRDFLCIIAGYENELENCFFKYNPGLRRRFTFRYAMDPYSDYELLKIFEHKVSLIGWSMIYDVVESDSEEDISRKKMLKDEMCKMFKKNIRSFPNYGGDIESLLLNCKIVHTRKCTFGENISKRTLTLEDVEEGINNFLKNRKYDKVKKGKSDTSVVNVYFDTDPAIYS